MKTSSPKSNDNIYPVKIEHYKIIRDIGKGSYGLVHEAIVLKGPRLNEHVAVKQMNVDKFDQKKMNHILNEIKIMTSTEHKHLISSHTVFYQGTTIYIIMPIMNYGDLSLLMKLYHPNGIHNEIIISTIMRDCLLALECLNNNNYFHRDIKASNILLSVDGSIKLGDYGVSSVIKKEGNNSYVGSLCWMAPEVARGNVYGYKVDIWSLGITAIEIANGKPPFVGLSPFEYIREVVDGAVPELSDTKYKWSQEFKDFVKSCLVKDPNMRPSARGILDNNKQFFSKAKNNEYILQTLLKGVTFIQDRFPEKQNKIEKTNIDKDSEILDGKNKMNGNYIEGVDGIKGNSKYKCKKLRNIDMNVKDEEKKITAPSASTTVEKSSNNIKNIFGDLINMKEEEM